MKTWEAQVAKKVRQRYLGKQLRKGAATMALVLVVILGIAKGSDLNSSASNSELLSFIDGQVQGVLLLDMTDDPSSLVWEF